MQQTKMDNSQQNMANEDKELSPFVSYKKLRGKILFKLWSIEKRKDCHIYCAEMNEILNEGLKYKSMWIHVVNEKTMWTKIYCIIVLTCPLNLKSTWTCKAEVIGPRTLVLYNKDWQRCFSMHSVPVTDFRVLLGGASEILGQKAIHRGLINTDQYCKHEKRS